MITLRFKDFDEMMWFAERLTGPAVNRVPEAPAPMSASTAAQPGPAAAPAQPAPTAPPIQFPVQQAPVAQQAMQGVPAQPAPLQPPVMAGVPTSVPSYTADDLARAAMTLMDSGRQQELIGLLQNFGVSSLPDLRPEQYGAFATALRGMGAQI